ncbi:MAG: hypothetical protein Q7K26_02010 [bacterium]|nr:hypothetical protein [bacterium]
MAGIFKKIVRFYAYPIIRPAEIIGASVKAIGSSLKEASGNNIDPDDLLTFDEVKANREAVADLVEQRDLQRERAGRRVGLFILGVFAIVCVVALFNFVVAIGARDAQSAKGHAINFLVGLFICAAGAIWIQSFFAKRSLPSLDALLVHLILIKRLLILMLTVSIAVFIVNLAFVRVMGVILSLAGMCLILSYLFRYSLRIEQLKSGSQLSASSFYRKTGWTNFFNMEFGE